MQSVQPPQQRLEGLSRDRALRVMLYTPEYFQFPYQRLAELREQHRVVWDMALNSWMLLRYDDIDAALRSKQLGAGMDGFLTRASELQGSRADGRPFPEMMRRNLQNKNPPDHARMRSALNRAFTPQAVRGWRPRIEQLAQQLLTDVPDGEAFDVISGFAAQLPLRVIAEILGIPDVDVASVTAWSGGMARGFTPLSPADLDAADRAQIAFREYAIGLVSERRQHPSGDLLSILINDAHGEDRITDDELLDFVGGLLFAGHETTKNLIGSGLLLLLSNCKQLELLRADRTLLTGAIEEMLRVEPPIVASVRMVQTETEFAGVDMRPGELVACIATAGNRDPRKFATPDSFDIRRSEAPSLSFGGGIHYCLGAQLGRLEGIVMFQALLDTFSRMELAEAELKWRIGGLRGLERLRVCFYR